MVHPFSFPFIPELSRKEPVVIVSGLPRSGTSMMMKMLAEGGLPVLTDGVRRADPDNPNGYFEFEAIRDLKRGNAAWLENAGGQGVKAISTFLAYLPPEQAYKIIFMERDRREVVASQNKFMANHEQLPRLDDVELARQHEEHLAAMKAWLPSQPNMDVLFVNYNALLVQPEDSAEQISAFLSLSLNTTRMLTVPDERLYRNQAALDE